jgi:hypothetical protein
MCFFVAPDVNGPRNYHPGNEAMLGANLHTFRQIFRDIEFTVLSGEPAWTSDRYGVESRQGPRLPAGHTAEISTRRMAEAGDAGRGWAEWRGDEIANALRQPARLVISGGGNVSISLWGPCSLPAPSAA